MRLPLTDILPRPGSSGVRSARKGAPHAVILRLEFDDGDCFDQ